MPKCSWHLRVKNVRGLLLSLVYIMKTFSKYVPNLPSTSWEVSGDGGNV